MLYGMKRTTVFLPDELKVQLEAAAIAENTSEAELIREGIRLVVARRRADGPRIPLLASGDSTLAERVDELLEGFGEP
jgi:Arc/MetJ-type ribon-helix-helix transcriptional regulator